MSRRQCCLCEDAKQVVADAAERGFCTWEIVNVDADKALMIRYGKDVPVLLIDGVKRFEHRVTSESLHQALEVEVC